MRIQTEYSSYDFQAHQQRSQRRCCFSQTALLWFEVLPDMSLALPGLSLALPGLSLALPGAPRLVVGAPRLVSGAPSYSEDRQECPPRVWYSPEIDASKFTLHILSDTPGGFQWLKHILLMCWQRDRPHRRRRIQCPDNSFRCSGNGHGTCEAYSYQLCDVCESLCHECGEDHPDS